MCCRLLKLQQQQKKTLEEAGKTAITDRLADIRAISSPRPPECRAVMATCPLT